MGVFTRKHPGKGGQPVHLPKQDCDRPIMGGTVDRPDADQAHIVEPARNWRPIQEVPKVLGAKANRDLDRFMDIKPVFGRGDLI